MKFKINVSSMIENVTGFIKLSSRGGMKDFAGFNKINLKSDKQGLTVSIFNGQSVAYGTLTNINIDNLSFINQKDGQATVDAKYLQNALKSFKDNEIVIVQSDKSSLSIKRELDEQQFNTITVYTQSVQIPQQPKKYVTQISMNKELFKKAIKKIQFAFGFQQTRPKFKNWALRLDKNYVRFASGTGSLFAVNSYTGVGITSINKKVNLSINNDVTQKQIMPFLNMLTDTDIIIKVSDKNDKYQMSVGDSNFTMRIVGLDSQIEFVDENLLLQKTFDNKYVTNIKDWSYATMGALATFSQDMKKQAKPSRSLMQFDATTKSLSVKTDDTLKSKRKIAILDSKVVSDLHKCSTYSQYISNIPTCYEDSGNIQICCESGAGTKAVVVYYNASDKVSDQTLLKVTSPLGYEQQFALIFIQMIA